MHEHKEEQPPIDAFVGPAGELVPTVDPADIKSLWTYGQEVRTRHPEGGVATGISVLKHLCSPGADTRAVSYRCTMLGMLEAWLESAWPGGQPSDDAFTVAAQMELTWMAVGVPTKGLPFDVGEFLGQVHGLALYRNVVGSDEKGLA